MALRELAMVATSQVLEQALTQPPRPERDAHIAQLLNNQSNRLSDLGRREAALEANEEAVAIRRRLAEARPDAFLPELAGSLNNQSVQLANLGRREAALDAIYEAIRFVLPLLERAPYLLPDAGLQLAQLYLKRCEEMEREPDEDLLQRMYAVLVGAGMLTEQ